MIYIYTYTKRYIFTSFGLIEPFSTLSDLEDFPLKGL